MVVFMINDIIITIGFTLIRHYVLSSSHWGFTKAIWILSVILGTVIKGLISVVFRVEWLPLNKNYLLIW